MAPQNQGFLAPRDARKPFQWSLNTYKIKKLERKVAALQPELKTIQYSFVDSILNNTIGLQDLFATIVQGDGENQRLGDDIKVKSLSIRGNANGASGANADFYLVKMNNNDPSNPPVYGDFIGVYGGHIDRDDGEEIYHKHCGHADLDVINYNHKFKYPLNVKFNRAGAVEKNKWYMVVKNDSGGTIASELSVQIMYYDI